MLKLLTTAVLLTATPILSAATVTEESAVAHALHSNPELLAARLRIDEAAGRLMHSGRLANPELEAELKPNLEGREFSAGFGVTQKIPLADRLRLERQVSQADLEVARLEVRAAERALALQVYTLVVKGLDVQGRRELYQRRVEHSRKLEATATRAAAAGEGSNLAAAEFELEAGEVEARLLQLNAEEASLLGALRPLLGIEPREPISLRGRLADPSDSPRAAEPALDRRPDYQAAESRLASARRNLDLQRASKWEDIAVGIGYEREHTEDAGFGMRRENFIGLKVSVPLPLGKNNLSHIREAEATVRRREAELVALASSLRAEAATAHAEMQSAARVYGMTSGTLLEKARALEQRFLAAYQSGQSPFTDVLRSRERRFTLEASALEARRDFHLARVRLNAALGR